MQNTIFKSDEEEINALNNGVVKYKSDEEELASMNSPSLLQESEDSAEVQPSKRPSLTPILSMSDNPKQEAEKIKTAITDSFIFGVKPDVAYIFGDEINKAKTIRNIDVQKMKGESTLGKPVQERQETEKPDIVAQTVKTVWGGLVDTAKLPWQALRIYGGLTEFIGGSKDIVPFASQNIAEIEAVKKELNLGVPEDIQKSVPKTLDEAFSMKAIPWWWHSTLQTGTSMIPSFGAAGAVIGAGRSALSAMVSGGFVGGLMESENTYNEAKEKGWSNEEAAVASLEMMVTSGLLNSLSLSKFLRALPPTMAGKVFRIFGNNTFEYVTELAEEPSEALILNESIQEAIKATKDAAISLLPVFITGIPASVAGAEITKKTMTLTPKQQAIIKKQQGLLGDEWRNLTGEEASKKINDASTMPLGVEAVYQGTVDGLMATGMNEEQANAKAVETILQTDEGRDYVQNIMDVTADVAKTTQVQETQPFPEETISLTIDNLMEQDIESMTDEEIGQRLEPAKSPAELTIEAEQAKMREAQTQGLTREQQLEETQFNAIKTGKALDMLIDDKSLRSHIDEKIASMKDLPEADKVNALKVAENNVRELLMTKYAKETDPIAKKEILDAEKRLNNDFADAYEKHITGEASTEQKTQGKVKVGERIKLYQGGSKEGVISGFVTDSEKVARDYAIKAKKAGYTPTIRWTYADDMPKGTFSNDAGEIVSPQEYFKKHSEAGTAYPEQIKWRGEIEPTIVHIAPLPEGKAGEVKEQYKTLYHGTGEDFENFNSDIVFATSDKKYAEAYTFKGNKPNIKEINVQLKNPVKLDEYADFKLTTTLQELTDVLESNGYKNIAKDLSSSEYKDIYPEGYEFEAWEVLSSNTFKDIAVKYGHDGVIGTEGGHEIYGIYDKVSIKSPEVLKDYPDLQKQVTEQKASVIFNEQGAVDIDKFTELGHSVWAEGKQTYEAFTARIKEVLGKAWEKVKDFISQVWESVKSFNEGLGERGEIRQVYHGSPYKFTKFADEKIGTGEGAQAFGYGHYLTESPAVARTYAMQGGKKSGSLFINKQPVEGNEIHQKISDAMIEANGNRSEALKIVDRDLFGLSNIPEPNITVRKLIDLNSKAKNILKNAESVEIPIYNYTATINKGKPSSEDVFLEWDKSVGEEMMNRLRSAGFNYPNDSIVRKGSDIYEGIYASNTKNSIGGMRMPALAGQMTSEQLSKAGITGIKYPTGTLSGVKGSDKYNYVVFDPKNITITYINGEVISPELENIAKEKILNNPNMTTDRAVAMATIDFMGGQQAYEAMMEIADGIYTSGSQSFKDFSSAMKDKSLKIWDKIKNIIREIWVQIKNFNEMLGESGAVGKEKELKSVIPTKDVKGQIREATGQTPFGRMVTEEEALMAGMIKAVRAARLAFKAGDKEGVAKQKAHYIEMARRLFEREQIKTAIKDLKKTAEKLSESPSVSADYRNRIKELIGQYELTGHTKEVIERLKATQEYIDRAKANGEDVEIPQRILDKLKILERIPKDQLTLDVVNGLKNEIELLGKLGKTKWSSKQALYEAEKEARKEALLDEASPINSHEMEQQPIGSEPRRWLERFFKLRNFLQKNRLSLRPIDGLADITGMKAMKNALDTDFNLYLTYNDEAFNKWLKFTEGFTQGQYEKIGAYAMAQQEGGIERLENSGRTRAEVEDIKLTDKEMEAYLFVKETFDKAFPSVKKYALDIYNKDVGQVDNYVSFMSDYSQMSDLEMWERFGENSYGGMKTKTTEQGFFKSRAGMSPIKLELNIDKIFIRHMDDVAYLLTTGRDIKQYFEIVNSPEMKEKLGDVGSLAWLQWLDLMARKGGSEGAKRIRGLDILRRNIGAGILAFRISSFMVQFTSFADTIATIGAEYATTGASHIATSKEWRSFIMDNFPEIKKAIGDDIAFREFGNAAFAKLTLKGLAPLRYLDGLMRTTAAAGAYQKLADEKGIEIDLKNPDKELIQEAMRLMRDSQGSSFFKDQPLAITTNYGLTDNRSLNKMLLQFQSFMLNRWENIERQIWRMGIKEGDYGKAFMSFFWLIIFASALEEGIRRGTRAIINLATGDIEKEKSFVGQAAMNVVQTVPVVGQIASSMSYASNPVPVIKAGEDFLGGTGSMIYGKEARTKLRGGVRALGAAGTLIGVPGSSQAAQFVNKALKEKRPKRRSQ